MAGRPARPTPRCRRSGCRRLSPASQISRDLQAAHAVVAQRPRCRDRAAVHSSVTEFPASAAIVLALVRQITFPTVRARRESAARHGRHRPAIRAMPSPAIARSKDEPFRLRRILQRRNAGFEQRDRRHCAFTRISRQQSFHHRRFADHRQRAVRRASGCAEILPRAPVPSRSARSRRKAPVWTNRARRRRLRA